jgi:sugar O-acyltransferase (sialic acid O-acetyltransferase NeuD family)
VEGDILLKDIVIVGASGHAKVILDIVEKQSGFNVIGLIDTFKPAGEKFFDYEVLGNETKLKSLVSEHGVDGGIVAIGDNWTRYEVVQRILSIVPEFAFVAAVHPSANAARGVAVGRGTVIMAGVSINSDSHIGDFCIVNTNASIDHDNIIHDYASLAPGATTGGDVTIEAFSAVSMGAKVVHGRTIGAHTVIGAGSTVLEDIPSHSVAVGSPAKVVRKRKEGEAYY